MQYQMTESRIDKGVYSRIGISVMRALTRRLANCYTNFPL